MCAACRSRPGRPPQRWPKSRLDLDEIGDVRGIGLDLFATIALLDEAAHHGLIARPIPGRPRRRTARGDAFAAARIGRRYPRKVAEEVLEAILTRAEAVNAETGLPFRVRRIDVYGSLIVPSIAALGDLDVFVETEATGPWSEVRERYAALVDPRPGRTGDGRPKRSPWPASWESRGSRILGKDSVTDPVAYGFAYRRVFDAGRGGRVEDPVVPERPRLATRKGLKARPAGVALPGSPHRPTHSGWFAPVEGGHLGDPDHVPWPDRHDLIGQVRYSGLALHCLAGPDDAIAQTQDLVRATLAGGALDGRGRIALVVVTHRVCKTTWTWTATAHACAVVERRMTRTRGRTTVGAEIVALACGDLTAARIATIPLHHRLWLSIASSRLTPRWRA